MSEYPRNGKFLNIEGEASQNEEESKKKKLAKAGKNALTLGVIAASAGSVLTRDLFANSKAAAESQLEPEVKHEQVIENYSDKPLSFNEFVKKGTEKKVSSAHLQLMETAGASSLGEKAESGLNTQNIYAGYSENGYRTSNENRASGIEIIMKREADKMLSYIKGAEQATGNNLLAISADISRANRQSDYRREQTTDWGTVQRVIDEKNPKAGAIVNIVAGIIRGQGGRLGRVSQETDNVLYSRVREAKIVNANFQEDFFTLRIQATRGEKKGGKVDFSKQGTEVYEYNFAIETDRVTVEIRGLDDSWRTETTTTYSLKEADSLVNKGYVAQDDGKQLHAYYEDDGLMSTEEKAQLGPGIVSLDNTQEVNDQRKLFNYMVIAGQSDALRRMNGESGDTVVAKRIAEDQRIRAAEILRQQQERDAQKQAKKKPKK